MKPISRKLTISIKDEDENETLATLTADFNLPTYFDEISTAPSVVVPSIDKDELNDRFTTALKTAADKLGE